jgi:hypothetical protein
MPMAEVVNKAGRCIAVRSLSLINIIFRLNVVKYLPYQRNCDTFHELTASCSLHYITYPTWYGMKKVCGCLFRSVLRFCKIEFILEYISLQNQNPHLNSWICKLFLNYIVTQMNLIIYCTTRTYIFQWAREDADGDIISRLHSTTSAPSSFTACLRPSENTSYRVFSSLPTSPLHFLPCFLA